MRLTDEQKTLIANLLDSEAYRVSSLIDYEEKHEDKIARLAKSKETHGLAEMFRTMTVELKKGTR